MGVALVNYIGTVARMLTGVSTGGPCANCEAESNSLLLNGLFAVLIAILGLHGVWSVFAP